MIPKLRPISCLIAGLILPVFSASADILLVEKAEVRRYTDGGTFLGTFAEGMDIPLSVRRSDAPIAWPPGVFGLQNPLGVTQATPDGHYFISQFGSGEIRKYNAEGVDLGTVLSGQPDWQPAGVAWNDGRLYAASHRHKAIASYATDSLAEDGDPNTPEPQRVLEGLAEAASGLCSAGERGGVYFTTSDETTGKGSLGYWSGQSSDPAEILCTFPEGSQPRGVAVAEKGFFVALMGSGTISKVDSEGNAEDWLIGLLNPVGASIQSGRLYVSQHSDRTVKAYDLSDKSVQTIITARSNPQYFAFVPSEATDQIARGRSVWLSDPGPKDSPIARIRADLQLAQLPFLSWDTEGGERAKMNLLRSPVTLSARSGDGEIALTGSGTLRGENEVVFDFAAPDATIIWTVAVNDGGIRMGFTASGEGLDRLQGLVLRFPYDPSATATHPLVDEFSRQGVFRLPALINAPDLGAMRVTSATVPDLEGSWRGSRETRSTTLEFQLPVPTPDEETVLTFEPWNLPQPASVKDSALWQSARRGWLNLLQTRCLGMQGDFIHNISLPERPAGVWANNTLSCPVGSTVFWLADHVLLIPQLAPDVSATSLLRRTVELWVNDGTSPEGQVFYVWRGGEPADSNPAVLIGAWAYVEATGDIDWFKRHAERLEFISQYMEKCDIDGDGLIESPQSGNRNTNTHGETAWDCISSGHKNAYVNALAYRAWRGLAQMQERAGQPEKAARYSQLADQLKKVYRETFYNPETGWLGWWRSADGELHDLWSDMPTSMAIMYGLITPEDGRTMLDKYWTELEKTGFDNFELGLPLNIRPIPPSLMLTGHGGKLEDGSDNYGKWLNGGLCLSNTSFWLAANYFVGTNERADMVLNAMLARQKRSAFPNGGAFQNGVVDNPPNGGENFDWEGNPSGYEGHLVYSWTWMQSMMLKDPATRARVFGTLQ